MSRLARPGRPQTSRGSCQEHQQSKVVAWLINPARRLCLHLLCFFLLSGPKKVLTGPEFEDIVRSATARRGQKNKSDGDALSSSVLQKRYGQRSLSRRRMTTEIAVEGGRVYVEDCY